MKNIKSDVQKACGKTKWSTALCRSGSLMYVYTREDKEKQKYGQLCLYYHTLIKLSKFEQTTLVQLL